MSNQARLLTLSAIMAGIVLAVTAISVHMLYTAAFQQQEARLTELARAEARILEAIARQETAEHGNGQTRSIQEAVLSQARDAQTAYAGLGQTGEFMLGRRDGDTIVYEFRSRFAPPGSAPITIPWASDRGEPIRRALSGHSGSLVGLDYRGVRVLAACEPVAPYGWGVVAKIDLAEIRAPFVRAAAVAGTAAIVLIAAGATLFVRITNPIARHIRKTEGTLRSLFGNMGEGVAFCRIVRDDDGRPVNYVILDANPQFERILQVRREQVVGKTATEVYGTADPPFLADHAAVADTGTPCEFETCFAPLGRWFHISVAPLEKDDFATIFSDISQRKRDEQELAHANTELQQKNAEMEQFIYTVSHDLKSPLVTIEGFAGHLRQGTGDDRQIRYIEHIQNATTRMRQFIDHLLDLSRIGRVTNPPEPVDVADLAREILRHHEGELADRGAEATVQDDMPLIRADRVRIEQVFDNLIGNALQHGAETNLRIAVGSVSNEHEVLYFVRDNGPGIPREHHQRIFDLFCRLNARVKGTGVGLAIVKRAVEVHGGRVWVESEAGHGATFWVAFPKTMTADVQAVLA